MSSDIIIAAKDLAKTYRIARHPLGHLLSRMPWFGARHVQYHRALSEISFEVRRGESVGIIGRNGSGKSTLLQLICGISRPTSGRLTVTGRLAALLELGAGFHPELTGRENVFLNGAILGFSAQDVRAVFDDIVGFADIGSYIDHPVRTYSSGMFVRLAFAAATHFRPEILIVDEALAVGDSLFQKRCHARIQELGRQGVTFLFVSHDHELIRTLTSKALLLDQGKMLFWGDTKEATRRYRKLLFEEEAVYWSRATADGRLPGTPPDTSDKTYGVGGARLLSLTIGDVTSAPRNVFEPGETIRFDLAALCETDLDRLNLSIVIRNERGDKIYSWGTLNQDIAIRAGRACGPLFWEQRFSKGDTVSVTIEAKCHLGHGNYEVQTIVSRELTPYYGTQQVLHWRDEVAFFRVAMKQKEYFFGGLCDLEAICYQRDCLHHDDPSALSSS